MMEDDDDDDGRKIGKDTRAIGLKMKGPSGREQSVKTDMY